MTNSRLVEILAVFLFVFIVGSPPAHGRDCIIGFPVHYPPGCDTGGERVTPVQTQALCAMKQPLDARHSTITWFDCDQSVAARTAEAKARSDAARFANGSLGNRPCTASSATCTATCASAGSTPLHGAAAANVSFDRFRQIHGGFPGDGDIQIVNPTAGVCSSTVVQTNDSVPSSGSKSCGTQPPPHYTGPWYWNYAPYGTKVTASAFCGCICH
jgi:hypothetical protein